jgi:acyl dehydratase
MDPIRSFDDLSVGQEFHFGTMVMPLEEMLDFAHRFDPQPFHVDEARAKAGPFGGIIASGIHTLWPPPSATCCGPG